MEWEVRGTCGNGASGQGCRSVRRIAVEAPGGASGRGAEWNVSRNRNSPSSPDSCKAIPIYFTRLALALREYDCVRRERGSNYRQLLEGCRQGVANIADVCLGIHSEPSAEFLKRYLTETASVPVSNADPTSAFAKHIVRHGPKGSLAWIIEFAQEKYAERSCSHRNHTQRNSAGHAGTRSQVAGPARKRPPRRRSPSACCKRSGRATCSLAPSWPAP